MEQIPKWIIDYDKYNYQSSAGKAIRILLQEIEILEREINEMLIIKKNENK